MVEKENKSNSDVKKTYENKLLNKVMYLFHSNKMIIDAYFILATNCFVLIYA